MKLKKAIHEQSKENLEAFAKDLKFYPPPEAMYEPKKGDKGTNSAETTMSGKYANPDNEELVVAIERHCMLSNFAKAEELMKEHWDELSVQDLNRLIQFSKFIHGENIRSLADKKEKPPYEKFGPRIIKIVQKKLAPR